MGIKAPCQHFTRTSVVEDAHVKRKKYPEASALLGGIVPLCQDMLRNGRCRFQEERGYCRVSHPPYLKDSNIPRTFYNPRRCSICTLPVGDGSTCAKCVRGKPSRACSLRLHKSACAKFERLC